tara:strand:+ start:766 stop:1581 length:816 start_codon:yes stop_codon:yes gene_type:complete
MKFNFITLFPDFISPFLEEGVLGRAHKKNIIESKIVNPRDFTEDVHKTVDDKPYGGGDGMVMLSEPLERALVSITPLKHKVVYLSPQGSLWDNHKAQKWSESETQITFICGRYAGIDQRFINEYVDEEISIGNYVLSGGEVPAIVVADSMARFLPGVLGNHNSAFEESLQNNDLLEAPQFTRPDTVGDQVVPSVYRSGHHKKIQQAKEALAWVVTMKKRPELIQWNDSSKLKLKESLKIVKSWNIEELKSLGLELSEVTQMELELERGSSY